MQFSVQRSDPRIHALVVALHRDGAPAAETWRAVGEAAWKLGLPRPSYHTVRDLVGTESLRRRARTLARRAALDVALSLGTSRAVDVPIALHALEVAQARERLVSERHKPS